MGKSIYGPEHEAVVKLLRQARQEAGLTQAQVAAELALPQSFVSKYESGERRLDLVELRRVCRALNLPLQDFTRRWEKLVE